MSRACLLVLALVALTACGEAKPEPDSAREAAVRYFDALQRADYGDACEMLVAAVRTPAGDDCPRRLQTSWSIVSRDDLRRLRDRADGAPVDVRGGKAKINLRGPGGGPVFELLWEDGAFKVPPQTQTIW